MLDTQPSSWVMLTLAASVTFFSTAIGAVPSFFIKTMSTKLSDWLTGLSAGVMFAAAAYSLIEPSLNLFREHYSTWQTALAAGGMIMLGGYLLHFANERIPHEHFVRGREGKGHDSVQLKRIWLYVLAITIHNIPEGLAVGVGAGSGNLALGLPVMIGIGIQDIPEGLIVALALRSQNYTNRQSMMVAALTGVVEAIGAIAGFTAVHFFASILPWTLAFSGGMMIYIICHEMIPECHRNGFEREATFGIMIGFTAMVLLELLLR